MSKKWMTPDSQCETAAPPSGRSENVSIEQQGSATFLSSESYFYKTKMDTSFSHFVMFSLMLYFVHKHKILVFLNTHSPQLTIGLKHHQLYMP